MVRYLGTDSRHDSTLCERDIKFLNESSDVGAGSFSLLTVSPPVNTVVTDELSFLQRKSLKLKEVK